MAKGRITFSALERPLAGMRPNVSGKMRFDAELCLAMFAMKWLLASMSSLVSDQSGFVGKPFNAEGTGKWLVSGVRSLVSNQTAFHVERCIAIWTKKRVFAGVRSDVIFKVGFAGKFHVAIRTFLGSIRRSSCLLSGWSADMSRIRFTLTCAITARITFI